MLDRTTSELPDIRLRSRVLDFAADLFKAADKRCGNLEPSEYKHVALASSFNYIPEAFKLHHKKLEAHEYADSANPDEYLAEKDFWVPEAARWSH